MNTYPLSNAQKRIWYAQKKYQASSLFNIGGIVKINGEIRVSALSQAITQVVKNNVALNLQFKEDNNQVYQYISQKKCYVAYADFSSIADPQNSFEKWYKKQAQIPFVMVERPLYTFTIFKISKSVMGYFIKLHHIIADGWSIKLLTDQIIKSYEAIIKDELYEDEEIPSYIDYVIEEETYINSVYFNKAKDYWNHMFSLLPELPTALHNKLNGQRISFVIEDILFNKIDNYIKEQGITINTFFVGIYLLYEYKKYGKKDIILGTPLLGRSGKKERQTFGTFTNTMPYRYVINNNELISEMMQEVSSDLKSCYINQKYPYNLLVDELKLHENGIDRLYNVCINYYNTIINTSIDGLSIENTEFYNGEQDYGLQIILRHWDGVKLQLDFDYQTAVYSEKQINEMHNQLMILINQILNEDLLKVSNVLLLTQDEKHKVIYEFNNTKTNYPSNKTWLDLFEGIIKSTPNKTAISKNSKYFTYQELDFKANCLAHHLQKIGVQTNTIVGALIEHDMESIVAILAIMKCGATYLPIDVNSPLNRTKDIIISSGAKFLIVNDESIDDFKGIVISLKEINTISNAPSNINLCKPSDTAYMIFTSGSTGIPKGVMVSHKNLMNYLCWAKKTYVKSENEVFALYSSFAFDFTMTSIFLPLISGGEVRVYDNARDENVFEKIINDKKATIVKITPSHIPLINDLAINNSTIHTYVIGGENLKVESCRRLYEHFNKSVDIYNEYGPTEATVGCMIYLYNYEKDNNDSIPIGRPIDNTQIYLLDEKLLPVPNNTMGEVYISGDSLSKGYYNLLDETNKRFIKNPYRSGDIMYKTGDIAYRNNEGILVFSGRCDDEIKIRGNRVNLSEIEHKILSSGMAEDAVVIPVNCDNDSIQLCAYILQNGKYNLETLKEYLVSCLPIYMLPQFYVSMSKLPLTINGKIDRGKLPNPLNHYQDKNEINKEKSSQIEILITAISSVITDININSDDNFYALGGDSIKAIQISSRLNEKGYELTVRDILTNPVINQMIDFMKIKSDKKIEQSICSGEIMKTPIISWFFEENFKDEGHYNQSILLELKQGLSIKLLNEMFLELIKLHDALRINYDKRNDNLYYNNNHLSNHSIVNVVHQPNEQSVDLSSIIKMNINHNFDLEKDLLIRPYSIFIAEKNYLYITAHHLVVDGVSWRIILEDIESLLRNLQQGKTVQMPEKTLSFVEYAKEYNRWAENLQINDIYWRKVYEYSTMKLQTHLSKATYGQIKKLQFQLDKSDTQLFLSKANELYNTTPNELLVIALSFTIKELYHTNEMVIEVERHGRDILKDMNMNRTVGWFTNMFPLHIQIPSTCFINQMKSMKEQFKDAWQKGYEHGIVKYIKKQPYTRKKLKHISLNYLGEYTEQKNDYFTLKKLSFESDVSSNNEIPFCIDVNAIIYDMQLNVSIAYFDDPENNETPDNIFACFKKHFINILEHQNKLIV